MRMIDVSGAADTAPTVHIDTPLHTADTQFDDVRAGTGNVPITTAAQMVGLDVTLYDATTGAPLAATSYDSSTTRVMPLSTWAQSFPAFKAALHCATTGARVAIAMAPGGTTAATAQSFGVGPDTSMVAVVDVRQVFLAAANGSPVYNSGFGLPSVVRAPNGRPGVIVRDNNPPAKLTVEVLKQGAGQKVTGNAPVVLHYTVVNWKSQTLAETTWTGAPHIVTLSTQSKGFRDAVVGQRVGSQVMAVIPPADGAQGTTQTQIAVIDILGVTTAAAAQQQQQQ